MSIVISEERSKSRSTINSYLKSSRGPIDNPDYENKDTQPEIPHDRDFSRKTMSLIMTDRCLSQSSMGRMIQQAIIKQE